MGRIRVAAAAVVLAFGVGVAGAATASSVGAPSLEAAGSPQAAAPVARGAAAVVDTSVDAACTRKVKVVYAGYGEAQRAECGTITR